ncbi:Hypothetical predicted protein [Olea europaea subsp. europaea]|uniref:Uncharacterized protein n=1 Tax=Olea europaea subsp. europaea TaxID=158383 RepID=A0A8S0TSA9_OLEEU|nr:Hypothetical predicted protein [Olea europaea subsp. europaea]
MPLCADSILSRRLSSSDGARQHRTPVESILRRASNRWVASLHSLKTYSVIRHNVPKNSVRKKELCSNECQVSLSIKFMRRGLPRLAIAEADDLALHRGLLAEVLAAADAVLSPVRATLGTQAPARYVSDASGKQDNNKQAPERSHVKTEREFTLERVPGLGLFVGPLRGPRANRTLISPRLIRKHSFAQATTRELFRDDSSNNKRVSLTLVCSYELIILRLMTMANVHELRGRDARLLVEVLAAIRAIVALVEAALGRGGPLVPSVRF